MSIEDSKARAVCEKHMNKTTIGRTAAISFAKDQHENAGLLQEKRQALFRQLMQDEEYPAIRKMRLTTTKSSKVKITYELAASKDACVLTTLFTKVYRKQPHTSMALTKELV